MLVRMLVGVGFERCPVESAIPVDASEGKSDKAGCVRGSSMLGEQFKAAGRAWRYTPLA